MNAVLAQTGSGLFDLAFTAAVFVAGLLLLGGLASFVVFLYRSVRGDGMRDPREVAPEKAGDEGLQEGDSEDEWDYY